MIATFQKNATYSNGFHPSSAVKASELAPGERPEINYFVG